MTDQDTPQPVEGQPQEKDSLVEVLRDIPRMRELNDDRWAGKVFEPPPPMVSRLGGTAQGCGGILLILTSLPMLLVAMWYGFYVWGPMMLFAGGLLLTAGSPNVFRGRKTALIAGVVVLVGLLLVAMQWTEFVSAAGALAPLGQFATFYAPLAMLMGIALVIAFLLHAVALAYWKRLKPLHPTGNIIWAAAIAALVILSVVAHFVQQNQRKAWVDDKLEIWSVSAADSDLRLGANANVTLGYSFVTLEEGDDNRFAIREAELKAALESGAAVLRMAVSGDLKLEADKPLMFVDTDAKDGETERTEAEIEARRTVRFESQAEAEGAYLARVADAGVDIYLTDSQYSPYLLVWASDEDIEGDEVPWADFTALHIERARTYAELKPAYYEVVNEPSAYAGFSAVEEPGEDDAARLDAWVTHTEDLIAAVREVSPETKIGVGISLTDDFDLDYYERVLALDDLDFVSFRVFQSAAYDRLIDVFTERGAPADSGKGWWISETWFGYCLAPQRSMALDSDWLAVAVAFGAQYGATGVMPTDFGCFIEPGGTLFGDMTDPTNRTEVFKAWTTLATEWSGAGAAENKE